MSCYEDLSLLSLICPSDMIVCVGVYTYISHICMYMHIYTQGTSLVTQTVKNLPAMQETQETWVQSLGWEDPLEKEMGAHSSILAWKIPWTEEPCRLQSLGSQRVRHDWATNSILYIHKHIYMLIFSYIYTHTYIYHIYILKIYLSHFMGSSLTFQTKAPALHRNALSCGGDLSWIKNDY